MKPTQAELDRACQSDVVLAYMVKKKMPLTRRVYDSINWMFGDRPKFCAELESEVPRFLQRWPKDETQKKRDRR